MVHTLDFLVFSDKGVKPSPASSLTCLVGDVKETTSLFEKSKGFSLVTVVWPVGVGASCGFCRTVIAFLLRHGCRRKLMKP